MVVKPLTDAKHIPVYISHIGGCSEESYISWEFGGLQVEDVALRIHLPRAWLLFQFFL
jgi:hypothetical protein